MLTEENKLNKPRANNDNPKMTSNFKRKSRRRASQQNLLRGIEYKPNMPKLVNMHKMDDNDIYAQLCKISNSPYSGWNVKHLRESLSFHDAHKLLVKLILINDRDKSQLYMISEKSSGPLFSVISAIAAA